MNIPNRVIVATLIDIVLSLFISVVTGTNFLFAYIGYLIFNVLLALSIPGYSEMVNFMVSDIMDKFDIEDN